MNMAVATYNPQVLVDTNGLTEKEWLEWRRKGVGGSDASIILGISPFATARDLYYDKLNVVSYKDDADIWVALQIGHLLEDLVAAAVNEAVREATETAAIEMEKITGGVNLPGIL